MGRRNKGKPIKQKWSNKTILSKVRLEVCSNKIDTVVNFDYVFNRAPIHRPGWYILIYFFLVWTFVLEYYVVKGNKDGTLYHLFLVGSFEIDPGLPQRSFTDNWNRMESHFCVVCHSMCSYCFVQSLFCHRYYDQCKVSSNQGLPTGFSVSFGYLETASFAKSFIQFQFQDNRSHSISWLLQAFTLIQPERCCIG